MPDVCQSCTETVNPNYTIRTGQVYVCGPDAVTRALGNVQVLDFSFTPNVFEHRSGEDGSLDAIIPISEDFRIVITADELTPANMSYILGQDMVQTVEGCEIALDRPDCDRKYAVQFLHEFPCSALSLQIDIWSALILSEMTMQFGESPLSFPINIRATKCASLHPAQPYGRMLFSQSCPTS